MWLLLSACTAAPEPAAEPEIPRLCTPLPRPEPPGQRPTDDVWWSAEATPASNLVQGRTRDGLFRKAEIAAAEALLADFGRSVPDRAGVEPHGIRPNTWMRVYLEDGADPDTLRPLNARHHASIDSRTGTVLRIRFEHQVDPGVLPRTYMAHAAVASAVFTDSFVGTGTLDLQVFEKRDRTHIVLQDDGGGHAEPTHEVYVRRHGESGFRLEPGDPPTHPEDLDEALALTERPEWWNVVRGARTLGLWICRNETRKAVDARAAEVGSRLVALLAHDDTEVRKHAYEAVRQWSGSHAAIDDARTWRDWSDTL